MLAHENETSGKELLSTTTVHAYLAARGLVSADAELSVWELGGGVSNVVLAVSGGGIDAVVKQALPRLRVADEWQATQARALTEAAALQLARTLTPSAVPAVLDVDEEAYTIVIARAPDGFTAWKERLLEGQADPEIAERVGALLGAWHQGTVDDAKAERRFSDRQAFDELRLDAYYRTAARRRPSLARAIGEYVEQLERTRVCLVHGDYSPKNVLVGPSGLWVVDFEVAHWGDPAFDLAFMLNHLLLKAIHRPAALDAYRACALAFVDAYRREAGGEVDPDPSSVLGHAGCLMVARVDGKSPAEYLREPERMLARALGATLLLEPPATVSEAFARLEGALR